MKNATLHGIRKTLIASFLALGALLPSQAAEVTAIRRGVYNDWGYIVTSANTVHIRTWLGGKGYREEVVVPGEIEGLPVTRIEEYANWDWKPDPNPETPDWKRIYIGDDPSDRELNCGRLVIDGKGNMVIAGPAFVDDTLRELVLRGVKEIESNVGNDTGAFRRCKNLVRVIADDALEIVDGQAFFENPNLESLTGATNLKRIGHLAFASDPKLKDVPVSEKLEHIGGYAFLDCTSITNVVFPNSLAGLEEHAFRGCDFIEEVTFGSGLKTITGANFNSKPRLRKITIPEGVEAIAGQAFEGCSVLPEVVFPDSLRDPGYWSFQYCPAITNIVIGKNGGMAYVPGAVFSAEMPNLDTVTINGNGETVINGKGGAFNGFKMRHLVLNGVKTIEDTNSGGAFRNCTNLVTVVEDGALEHVGVWAFAGCTALTTLEGFQNVTSIGRGAFEDCSSLPTINVPAKVGTIDSGAFARCASATTVVIPDSVTNVSDRAFTDCSAICSMAIGKGVNPIVQNLVPQGAEDLDTIIVKGNGETVIAGNAFFRCKMRHLVMSGVKTINGSCRECPNLEDVVADEALETIGDETFRACPKLRSVTGITGVKVIGKSAFGNYNLAYASPQLSEIELPEGLERIGEYAFANCANLTDVTVPDTVTNVGWRAWMQCLGLTNFTFGAGLNPIPGGLFDWFDGAMDVLTVNGDGTTAIADSAFSGMKINRVVLNGVTKVGGTAFQNNTMLTEVHFDGDAPVVGANAFASTPTNCTAYVPYGSTGWDVDIPLTGKADWNYDGIPGHSIKIAYANAPSGDVGAWLRFDLVNDLDIVIPEDVNYAEGDKVTVKVEGLPKGLKLVTTQQKETTGKKAVTNVVYTIEGVPTETVDFDTQTMYARVTVTYKDKTKGDKGKIETLQPIPLSIVPAKVPTLAAGVLNEVYEPVDIAALWPEVKDAKVNPTEWSFKGWPAGIKYNNKATDVNWSYKSPDGKSYGAIAVPYAVYGQPTKAGVFPITATWKHKLEDNKTTVSETFSAVLTVWGSEGEKYFRYTARAYGDPVDVTIADAKSVSGLPTGIKHDKETGKVTGTPTKPGDFVVTVTKKDDEKETFIWNVAPPDAPEFELDPGTAPVENLKVQIVQGANQAFAITATAGAKVTASGLPTGLKLVQDKTTGLYSVEGVATKPGEYFVTFKTVLNGVTTVTTTAFTVKGNPFTATYRGYLTARPADGAEKRLAIAEISVAAAGTVKLTYTEGKTKYTASVKSFDWNDTTGWGKVEGLVLKVSSADRQLGYGDRKATVAFNARDPVLYASLFLTDAEDTMLMPWAYDLYATVKTTEVKLPESQTFVFRTEDGADTNALATVSLAYDASKATAAFSGKLYDGTAVKATVPVLRWDDEGTPQEGTSDDYVFAPFLVIAKDGTVYRFERFSSAEDGGFICWVGEDGESGEEAGSANADFTPCDKRFAELVSETGSFAFGWGSDAATVGADAEEFAFEVTKDKEGKPKGVAIYDADSQSGEKPLATVTAKIGKLTGAISVSFTSKKGDKAKYAVELVWRGDKLFAGHVMRTWKGVDPVANKPVNLSASGTAEVTAATGDDYLVIDLSGGPDAESYPVSYRAAEPRGGWTDEYKTEKLVLRKIQPGTFTMGSPADEVGRCDYEDQHTVTLTKPFYMGVFEVTQRQWELVMGTKPSYFSNATWYKTRPVEQVSYDMIRGSTLGAKWPASSEVDATSFMGKIRAKTGLDEFDLPTEAQWEYACRAGTTTALNSGKNLTSIDNDANMNEVGRYWYNSGQSDSPSRASTSGTAEVGSFKPNEWGLYDMHGNVLEWCLDRHNFANLSDATDPVGASSDWWRVVRGGGWDNYAGGCRSAYRATFFYLSTANLYLGFRLSRTLP